MGDRGRKSGSELAVISSEGIETVSRPRPPVELTDEQAAEWQAVVNRLPAEWFPRETLGLLAQYCRHVVAARKVARMISTLDDQGEFDLDDYDKLLKMQEREGRALSSLATRMRITQQTTYDKSKKKGKAGKRPWEMDG